MHPHTIASRLRTLALMLVLVLPIGVATSPSASADGWREYTSGGRQWRETCEAYSTTVERCRTEIRATVATWTGRAFVVRNGWTFNNLLYKPSNRADWAGNPLATPGVHDVGGRRWKTECDTAWTGRHGCRSQVWAKVPAFDGRRYQFVTKWVFNNQVQFIPSTSTPVTNPDPGPDTVITPTTWPEVTTTYTLGCPVAPKDLRTIRINHWDMDGQVQRGEIIVRKDLADRVAGAFEDVYEAGFPVAQMRNPNEWNASDEAMMRDNNTSAFNCRRVVGNPTNLSPHSYGKAVDFNPVQNPYRDPTGKWWPSSTYSVNRPASVPGLHTDSSASVQAFRGRGFSWFKGWDWHHFEYRGGAARTTLTTGGLDTAALTEPVDAAKKGTDALAIGCAATTTDAPVPVAAAEGTLTPDGRPGVAVAMRFASDDEARDYFAAWTSQMRACEGESTTEITATDDTWLGHWSVDGTDWSEAGGLRGDVVKLTLLEADLNATELEAIAENF